MLFFFQFFSVLTLSFATSAKTSNICPHILVMDGSLSLNDNEKILVCGTSGAPGDNSESWREIPLTQSELHLKSIVQNLGYLNPRFEREGNNLRLWMGSRTRVQALKVHNDQGLLYPDKKRKIVGEPLVAAKLNEVESWANLTVRSQGYACPQVDVSATAWNGEIHLNTELGNKQSIGLIRADELDGLSSDILARYQPFRVGDPYDIRKTHIMVARMLGDGLFQSAYFFVKCHQDKVDLQLKSSIGKPKIVRFGFGASTEELPFVDLSFKNARLDNKASSFTTTLHASPRLMSLNLSAELYFFPGWHRTYFGPNFRVARESETVYETNTARAGVNVGQRWDMFDSRFNANIGSVLNYTKTVRGVGPRDATYPTIEGSLQAMSHKYEFLMQEQFDGWMTQFFYRGQGKGLGSEVDVKRYDWELKSLWNIQNFTPPLLVLGTRVQAIVVDANELDINQKRDLIPVDERIYMGGDQNLRGFPRQSLNNSGLGYLTAAYVGLELRLIEQLPFRLQPFVLWDGARLGNRRYTLDETTFVSEGLGLRWASPVGTIRASAARGRVIDRDERSQAYPEQWIYFFSFGQEF